MNGRAIRLRRRYSITNSRFLSRGKWASHPTSNLPEASFFKEDFPRRNAPAGKFSPATETTIPPPISSGSLPASEDWHAISIDWPEYGPRCATACGGRSAMRRVSHATSSPRTGTCGGDGAAKIPRVRNHPSGRVANRRNPDSGITDRLGRTV